MRARYSPRSIIFVVASVRPGAFAAGMAVAGGPAGGRGALRPPPPLPRGVGGGGRRRGGAGMPRAPRRPSQGDGEDGRAADEERVPHRASLWLPPANGMRPRLVDSGDGSAGASCSDMYAATAEISPSERRSAI